MTEIGMKRVKENLVWVKKQILMEEEPVLVHVSTQRCGLVQASFSNTPPWAAQFCCSGTDVCC